MIRVLRCVLPCMLVLLGACSSGLSPAEYVKYMDKNRDRFSYTVERSGVVATVLYQPNELYAARDMVADSALSGAKAMQRYENSLFLVIAIARADGKAGSLLLERDGPGGYTDNVMTNSFLRDRDVFIVSSADTVRPSRYDFERSWDIGSGEAFLFAFPRQSVQWANLSDYRVIVRNLAVEIGTLDIKLRVVAKAAKKLRNP